MAKLVAFKRSQAAREIPAPEFIIIDECHHVLANTYRKILDRYPISVLGFTATP